MDLSRICAARGARLGYFPFESDGVFELSCLISEFGGAIFSSDWKAALWAKFSTGAPRQRTPSEQRYSDPLPSRRCLQRREGQASAKELSETYGINPKTALKWRKRATVEDLKTGPKEPRSSVFSTEDEAIVVAFRRHTLPPLDDCLYALQPTLPHLTRSSLHRCLQRHGISRLPDVDGDKPAKQKFKGYPAARQRMLACARGEWIFPYRHRRVADGRRQAAHVRCDRPHIQIRHRQVGEESDVDGRPRLP